MTSLKEFHDHPIQHHTEPSVPRVRVRSRITAASVATARDPTARHDRASGKREGKLQEV